MHDAFDIVPVVEKLPIQIESIATFGSTLLVGTRKGHLIVYEVTKQSERPVGKFKVDLKKTNKNFSTRPIVQLTVVEELSIIISLSDNIVSVHDLETFGLRFKINKTQGANVFKADLKIHKPLGAPVPKYQLRLAVSVKRKIEFFEWKNGSFQDCNSELSLPDIPKMLAWCADSVAVGLKKEYLMIKTRTGKLIDLFPTGKNQEPFLIALPEGKLSLGKDEMSILVNAEGKPTQKHAIIWSETPLAMEYSEPYLIAVLPSLVEIRTIEPRLLIETLSISHPKYLAMGQAIYIASYNTIWRLSPKPIHVQINQLLGCSQYELALQLAEMIEDEDEDIDKAACLLDIKYKYAFHLFTQHRFEESLKRFAQLDTDPREIIGLFPSLLPKAHTKQYDYPTRVPVLAGAELEKGYQALVEYLMQKRNELYKKKDNQRGQESEEALAYVKDMSEIIDTTLLKCYVQVNERLVGPLLSLPNSHCHLLESERILRKFEKWSDLVLLYSSKNEHRKALSLLLEKAYIKSGPLSGHKRSVEYLQKLDSRHLDLIFEYSKWILKKFPDEGLKVFIDLDEDPQAEARQLPRKDVVTFLKTLNKELAITYLEHVINEWDDKTEELHNELVTLYIHIVDNEIDDPSVATDIEIEKFSPTRKKLMNFLERSKHYKATTLIRCLPHKLRLEKALMLGRVGRHVAALRIYALELKNEEMAEAYCRNMHRQGNASEEVYLALFRMYLGVEEETGGKALENPNILAALQVLTKHHQHIDTARALQELPDKTKLKEVRTFLEKVVEQQSVKRRHCQVLKSLYHSELLQVHQQRMQLESNRILISDERLCSSCRKRLQTSAFARHPDGTIEHYWCYEKKLKESTK